MNPSTNISAVIITYNEEAHIAGCLASLGEVVSEIVVVDSYSTDATKALCAKYSCRFLEHEWQGFAATKNWANDHVFHEWIVSIDADEVLSPALIQSIQDAQKVGLMDGFAYQFNRLNNYCGIWLKVAGWYPDTKVRLFAKGSAQWQGDIHEKLEHTQKVNLKHLKGDLLHYSIKDKEDHIARVKKYCRLEKPYPNQLIALIVALKTFIKSYLIKGGFRAGKLGFQVSYISAQAKWWRGRV